MEEDNNVGINNSGYSCDKIFMFSVEDVKNATLTDVQPELAIQVLLNTFKNEWLMEQINNTILEEYEKLSHT